MCCGFWQGFQFKYPKLVPVSCHIPNGGSRGNPADAKRTGALLKRMGVQPGFPDYMIMLPRGGWHGLFLEFKTDKGRLSDSQQFRLEALRGNDYAVAIVKSSDEAFSVIDLYLEHRYFPRPDFYYKPPTRRKRKKSGEPEN